MLLFHLPDSWKPLSLAGSSPICFVVYFSPFRVRTSPFIFAAVLAFFNISGLLLELGRDLSCYEQFLGHIHSQQIHLPLDYFCFPQPFPHQDERQNAQRWVFYHTLISTWVSILACRGSIEFLAWFLNFHLVPILTGF